MIFMNKYFIHYNNIFFIIEIAAATNKILE